MRKIQIPNWRGRPYQAASYRYMRGGGKRCVTVWHRRAGKDSTAAAWTSEAAFQRVGTYWHMLPTALQGRKVVWDRIDGDGERFIDRVFPKELRAGRPNKLEMKIELKNGSIWQVVGSDNYDALVGGNVVGLVMSEWALADPAAWDFLRPILLENDGWAWFPYTPRGKNHGFSMYEMAQGDETWFAEVLPWQRTGVFTEAQIEQERKELEASGRDAESVIAQEYECSFAAGMGGSYYAKVLQQAEDDGRIGVVPYEPGVAVDTHWDLGVSDAMAIWFTQQVGLELRVIDYHESSGQGWGHYVEELFQKRRYVYGTHWFPHDGGHRQIGDAEVRTLEEIVGDLGIRPVEVLPFKQDIAPAIELVRQVIGKARFDRERCRRGLDSLWSYRKRWNEKAQQYDDKPVHDWASHGADAARTMASSIETGGGLHSGLRLDFTPRGRPTGGQGWMAS